MKKIISFTAFTCLVFVAVSIIGCGNDDVKTETKTVTTISRTPTGIGRLWGEERVTREEKYEVRTLNAPK